MGVVEVFVQAAGYLNILLHPFTTALGLLGLKLPGDLDIAVWAIVAWVLGSREAEEAKKLGLILVALLAALALLETIFIQPG